MQPELRNIFLDIPRPSLPHNISDNSGKMGPGSAPQWWCFCWTQPSRHMALALEVVRWSSRACFPQPAPALPRLAVSQTCCVSTGPQASLVHSLDRPEPRTESTEHVSSDSRREMFLSKSLHVQPHITKDILTITFKKKNLLSTTRIIGMKVI